VPVGRRGGRD